MPSIMWQDTTRKLKETVLRSNSLRFWKVGGTVWIILIVVLAVAGGLLVMVATSRHP